MRGAGETVSTKGTHLTIDGRALRAAMEKVKGLRTPMTMNAMDDFSDVSKKRLQTALL